MTHNYRLTNSIIKETQVKMKGKKGDEILAELRGVPTSDKQLGDGRWDLLPRLLLGKELVECAKAGCSVSGTIFQMRPGREPAGGILNAIAVFSNVKETEKLIVLKVTTIILLFITTEHRLHQMLSHTVVQLLFHFNRVEVPD
ncbi:hypothetical protein F2P79_003599 [Pimephales promelas]|nr:hypothetical protein F2P79_003599 [Pimephales promelas]